MRYSGKPRRRGALGRLTALLFLLPMVLAACGGATTATNTPAAQATTAPTAAASNGAATTAATKPASTTAATVASGTAAPASTTAAASSATSGSAPAAASGAGFGTPLTTKRGEGGPLRLLWWQAPVILNIHLANGTKDTDASSLVTEPLARISSKSIIPDIPVLAKEIPSVQNGEISADYTTVTWKLKSGVTWSDGQPFTADDVVFTWQYIVKPETGSTSTALVFRY